MEGRNSREEARDSGGMEKGNQWDEEGFGRGGVEG